MVESLETELRKVVMLEWCQIWFFTLMSICTLKLEAASSSETLVPVCNVEGHAMAQLVEALRYKPEGRGFDSRWCHWIFSLT